MKNSITIFLSLFSIVFAQSSLLDLEKLNNSQIQQLKSEFEKNQKEDISNTEDIEIEKNSIAEVIELESLTKSKNFDSESSNEKYFGYEFFKSDINFFDNIPTPEDFRLGPGDEIILSLWGETNLIKKFLINKDGSIYYENLGFINVSNSTISEAESLLKDKLSLIYSTLNDLKNPTSLRLDLGKIKSVNVYFSGEIENPGIKLIHPFSDVFTAIVQAGGIKNSGSLRKVQLIRKGQVVGIFDFYDFFRNGKNNFSSKKIIDGDTIHIPIVENRIKVSGEVYIESIFELLENESLEQILMYAGGLLPQVGSKFFINRILPLEERNSDDYARTYKSYTILDNLNMSFYDGDEILFPPITDVSRNVKIGGRVKLPGEYPVAGLSLRDLLHLAGGFQDPVFLSSIQTDKILVLRKDSSNYSSISFEVSYENSDSFLLNVEDEVFVYEDKNFNKIDIVQVEGEIKFSGSYSYYKGMTVKDLINKAGGFSELANPEALIVEVESKFIDDDGNIEIIIDEVSNINQDFKLFANAKLIILPISNVVKVSGNVYETGLISYTKKATVKDYIEYAGGLMDNSLKNQIYIKRANGERERVSFPAFHKVNSGDEIVVPLNENPKEFDITSFAADFATILTNIAAILLVLNNQT
jgi:protein involved in polysaccharide export with SLBB domain